MSNANVGSSAKRQNRFKQNLRCEPHLFSSQSCLSYKPEEFSAHGCLREDIAAALDVQPSAILIQVGPPPSF